MTAEGRNKGGVMAHDPLADMESGAADQAEETAETQASAAPTAGADTIDLGDSLTIADVGELRERLRAALDLGGTLSVGAGDVEQVDAAGVQLLCAVAREADQQGIAVDWNGVSGRLKDAVVRLGLENALSL
jgi:ABC-type transporter Mla MlaB component